MYINLDGNFFFGGILKMLVLCNFLRKFMVSGKMIQRAFRTHTSLFIKQNPLEKIFIFTIYQIQKTIHWLYIFEEFYRKTR